jgi:DNA-directed RNA polymerase specialized sigma24 family protein
VQETLAWACAERDSYNPSKGTVAAWLYGMLTAVHHMHIDAWRSAGGGSEVNPASSGISLQRAGLTSGNLGDTEKDSDRHAYSVVQAAAPASPKPAARKYDWPPGITPEVIAAVARSSEMAALRAKLQRRTSSYPGPKLAARARWVKPFNPGGRTL